MRTVDSGDVCLCLDAMCDLMCISIRARAEECFEDTKDAFEEITGRLMEEQGDCFERSFEGQDSLPALKSQTHQELCPRCSESIFLDRLHGFQETAMEIGGTFGLFTARIVLRDPVSLRQAVEALEKELKILLESIEWRNVVDGHVYRWVPRFEEAWDDGRKRWTLNLYLLLHQREGVGHDVRAMLDRLQANWQDRFSDWCGAFSWRETRFVGEDPEKLRERIAEFCGVEEQKRNAELTRRMRAGELLEFFELLDRGTWSEANGVLRKRGWDGLRGWRYGGSCGRKPG